MSRTKSRHTLIFLWSDALQRDILARELARNLADPPYELEMPNERLLHVWWHGFLAVLAERSNEYLLLASFLDHTPSEAPPQKFHRALRLPKGKYKHDDERAAFALASVLRQYAVSKSQLLMFDDPVFGPLISSPQLMKLGKVFWQGMMVLDFFERREAEINIDAGDSGPADEQRWWHEEFVRRQQELRSALEPKLLDHCHRMKELDYDVPPLNAAHDVWGYLDPESLMLHEPVAGVVVADFRWQCPWDDEHGAAARLKDWEFVEVDNSLPVLG